MEEYHVRYAISFPKASELFTPPLYAEPVASYCRVATASRVPLYGVYNRDAYVRDRINKPMRDDGS
jgi:hypothetical protein